MVYKFENFELDTVRFELRNSGTPLAIEPQVFSLLELLVSNAGRMISKDEILEHVWQGRIVSEAALSSRIRTARQVMIKRSNRHQALDIQVWTRIRYHLHQLCNFIGRTAIFVFFSTRVHLYHDIKFVGKSLLVPGFVQRASNFFAINSFYHPQVRYCYDQ